MLIQNNAVRDLAWLISSPPIIDGDRENNHWTTLLFWQDQYNQLQQTLLALDKHPAPLHNLLHQQKDRRLGRYVETLMSFWFSTNDRYELIAHNLQVQEDNKTLGEFDFIVNDVLTNKTQHWELACKFYLGLGDTRQSDNWHGPLLKDRLAKKYHQMQTKQSQLSKRPASQFILSKQSIRIDQTICLMKGRLFYPLGQTEFQPPISVSKHHTKSWWATPSEFFERYKSATLQWSILNKQQWLAPITQSNPQQFSAINLLNTFHTDINRPICIASINPLESTVELERGFLVPENWGNKQANYAHAN